MSERRNVHLSGSVSTSDGHEGLALCVLVVGFCLLVAASWFCELWHVALVLEHGAEAVEAAFEELEDE